jgi:hypothetical protein
MDVRQWRTPAAFRRHLARYEYRHTAPWARGVVIHHTAAPLPRDWRGVRSVESLARYYRTMQQWGAGPHLFLALGSPNPDHDGLWQLTPLNIKGTHARAANATHWGFEHVGSFASAPPPPAVLAFSHAVTAALLDWAGLPVNTTTISPHAVWGKPTCPGARFDMVAYRRGVMAARQQGGS